MNTHHDVRLNLLASLSMDLKRAALGLHRGSYEMAKRFEKEALKREAELHELNNDPYISRLLEKTRAVIGTSDNEDRKIEDLLMYSVLFENYAQKYFNKNFR